MRKSEEADYRDFVVTRMDAWRRTAFLVCQDWHAADDLVAQALEKLYLRWRRISQVDNVDAYVRKMLVRAWIDETRRPYRREVSYADITEPSITTEDIGRCVTDQLTLADQLGELTPRKRAVLVLRFYCDLSVEETADALGITEGTVKSQTARGLERLRGLAATQLADIPVGSVGK